MAINPYLAGALLGLAAYAVLYFVATRRVLVEISKAELANEGLPDEERRKKAAVFNYVKFSARYLMPAILIGYFAYRGPDMFGGN